MNRIILFLAVGAATTFVLLSASGCKSLQQNGGLSMANLLGTTTADDTDIEDFDTFGEKNPDRLMLSDLGPGRIGTTLKSRFGGGNNRASAEESFRKGQQLYDQAIARFENDDRSEETNALFRQAANKFEVAAGQWPNSALQQDALFLQGEARFFANDYVPANRAYEILVNKYSGTKHLDLVESRRYEIALYWLSLARNGEGFTFGSNRRPNSGLAKSARRILHRIRLDDPTGKSADDATLALGNAFFEDGKYADAADAYEDLRKTYPGSPHQFHAHKFELKARLAAYRGAEYDGTDLQHAEKLLKTMIRQFPSEVEAERDYLASEGQRIREMLAARDWEVGNYYASRGENRAAKYYFAKVAGEYEDTQLAESAGERVAEVSDLPAVPEQKLPRLAELFPVKERNKPLLDSSNRGTTLR